MQPDGHPPILVETPADNEKQLQDRMKEHPDLLPFEEFGLVGPPLVVGRETSLASGAVDLLCAARGGEVVIIEFKTGPQNPDFPPPCRAARSSPSRWPPGRPGRSTSPSASAWPARSSFATMASALTATRRDGSCGGSPSGRDRQADRAALAPPQLHHHQFRRRRPAPRHARSGLARRPTNDDALRPGTAQP